VIHIVEVRYGGSDWADLLADMRSWLDRRQIEAVSSATRRSVAASSHVSASVMRNTRRHLRARFQGGWNRPTQTEPLRRGR